MSETETKPRRLMGFAAMTPEQRRLIASKGGRAAHKKGTAHEWTRQEASKAGQKGGRVSRGGRGRLLTATQHAQRETERIARENALRDTEPALSDRGRF